MVGAFVAKCNRPAVAGVLSLVAKFGCTATASGAVSSNTEPLFRVTSSFVLALLIAAASLAFFLQTCVNDAHSATQGRMQSLQLRSDPPLPPVIVSSSYIPSALELQWTANIAAWDAELCATLASPAQRDAVALLLNLFDSQEFFEAGTSSHTDLLLRAGNAGLFSQLDVLLEGGEKRTVLLEPLIGMLRDPRTGCRDIRPDAWQPIPGGQLEKKMWHLVSPPVEGIGSVRRSRHGPESSRAVLFDIGATAWGANERHDAHGARWLAGAYATVGVIFEDIYSWEAVQTKATDFFRNAELSDIGRMHFMNWAVSSGDDFDNPWHLLKNITAPQDFVVVKLDIDTPEIEGKLVQQLLEDSGLRRLVDVFYYEHHMHTHDFEWAWGHLGFQQTLKESYDIFVALRKLGIRAHSWP